MRPSPIRRSVLEEVCSLHQPFKAEQLIDACKQHRISIGTVYNSLDIFVKAGILRGAQRQRGHIATEYELIVNSANHMQFVCSKCGRTTDFKDKAITQLIGEHNYVNFTPRQFSLIVYGECKVCRKKLKV